MGGSAPHRRALEFGGGAKQHLGGERFGIRATLRSNSPHELVERGASRKWSSVTAPSRTATCRIQWTSAALRLDHILGVGHAAEHPVSHAEQNGRDAR